VKVRSVRDRVRALAQKNYSEKSRFEGYTDVAGAQPLVLQISYDYVATCALFTLRGLVAKNSRGSLAKER